MNTQLRTTDLYPGTLASIDEVLQLAGAYADAAGTLFSAASKGSGISVAPARLCAIHAVELYMNAFLRSRGETAQSIRGRLHNLDAADFVETLRIKKKTAAHLRDMTARREYLVARYSPDMTGEHTQLNRLKATLDEVGKKTVAYPGKGG